MCLYSKVKSEQKSRCGTTIFRSKSVTYLPGLRVYAAMLHNLPMNSAAPHPQGENPDVENPVVEKPILENPAQLSTK